MSQDFGVLDALKALSSIKQQTELVPDGGEEHRKSIYDYMAGSSPSVVASQSDNDESAKKCDVDPSVVLSWIYRVGWCAPMTLIQWMPLALSLVQLSVSGDPQVPEWVKGMIQPDLFLVTYSLIHMLVTVYIVNPPSVVGAIKYLVGQHQSSRDGCSKGVVQAKLVLILGLAAFGTVTGGFAFYPVIGSLPNLRNDTYPFWVNLIEEMSSMTALWQIMWWSTNLWIYALSGINFSTKIIDFVINYFRSPTIREADRVVKRMKDIGFDPDIMHGYVEMVRQGYQHHLTTLQDIDKNSLNTYLSSLELDPKDMLTAVIHKKLRESVSVTDYIAKAAVVLFTVAIAWGMLSFYLVAIQSLPVAVSLVEIAVSTGMINWLATSTVDFIRRLPTLSQKIFSWYLTPFHMLVHAAWLAYTCIGSIGEIFLETDPQLIPLQIVSNSLMISLFNIPAVFFLFLLIEEGFLRCSSSVLSVEKLRWKKFTKEYHGKLLSSLDDKFVANYLQQAFEEEGELQQLVFLYLWQGLPMGAPHGARNRLTIDSTLRHVLSQNSHDDPQLTYDGSREGSNHLGRLSNLKESAVVWRIINDVFRWGLVLSAFSYSMAQYESGIENPMHRLLEWEDWLKPEVVVPMVLLTLSAFIPGAVDAVRYCLEKGSRYRDINAVVCGKRHDLSIECDRAIESRFGRGAIQLTLWLVVAMPAIYVLYYLLSQISQLTVVNEIKNFTDEEQRAVEGFVQAGIYWLFTLVSAAIGKALGVIPTKCCLQGATSPRRITVFEMRDPPVLLTVKA